MTTEQLAAIEQKIHSDIISLKKRIEETEEFSEPIAPDNAIGRVSRMDAINNRSIFEASLRNNRERLKLLENSLKGLNEKDFGICRSCYQSIPIERLMVRPEIKKCADCK